ncbi:hypothetical protein NQ317_004140 [Molorchus minor]|uniref:C2H2-type domain-containing protein n=1 Tax=Molorchus minor TaxID=1323400 RepID=A0ABQ9J5E1_9CUCU|nr:hypothetical protein NQ317_004140 [Molorchus minor]
MEKRRNKAFAEICYAEISGTTGIRAVLGNRLLLQLLGLLCFLLLISTAPSPIPLCREPACIGSCLYSIIVENFVIRVIELKTFQTHSSEHSDNISSFLRKAGTHKHSRIDRHPSSITTEIQIPYSFKIYLCITKKVYHTTMESVTCASCVGIMTSYVNFAITCESTEEKINLYREIQQDEDIIKLGSILQFLGQGIQYNNVNIKKEVILDSLNYSSKRRDVKEELEVIDRREECKLKKVEIYRCEMCEYETKLKGSLKIHQLRHKDISEVQIFKCEICEYQTKHKANLKRHLLSHKDTSEVQIFKCEMCEFQTKHKGNLKTHLLSHKDISEVLRFKCEMCQYETRRRGDLKKHLLTHENISELPKFKCEMCDYQAKHIKYLKNHLLVHKDYSEVPIFKCETCEFQTKYAGALSRHLLNHKDVSEVQMFKCAMCEYQTKQKGDLKTHLVVHKDISEVQMFKCKMCGFQTRHRGSLKNHLVRHQPNSKEGQSDGDNNVINRENNSANG